MEALLEEVIKTGDSGQSMKGCSTSNDKAHSVGSQEGLGRKTAGNMKEKRSRASNSP